MIGSVASKNLNKDVSSYENLLLYIYTIGYPTEGEMIMTVLTDGSDVVFSMITDCYFANELMVGKFVRICNMHGINAIDAFVWTHPDKDHTAGMIKLLSLLDKKHKARIFLPEQVVSARNLCKEAKSAVTFLNETYNKKRPSTLYAMNVSGTSAQIMLSIALNAPCKISSITLKLIMLLPHNNVLFNKDLTKTGSRHNDLSIMYVLEFNGVRYLFCGDITKVNIPFIDNDYLCAIKYMKIPHHGSSEPSSIANILSQNGNGNLKMTTTICKKPNYLPEENAKTKYSIIGEAWCTGPEKDRSPKHSYGCIQMVFNASGKLITQKPTLKGNSYKWI